MNIKRIPFRTEDLHPEVRFEFSALAEDLALAYQADRTEFLLEPFEGFRSIDRQRHLRTVREGAPFCRPDTQGRGPPPGR